MQFVVPQFIEVENKIIGPISTRQFILLVILGVIEFLLFRLAPVWMFIIGGVITLVMFITLAFVKVNSQPFHLFLLAIIQTLKKPSQRVWTKAGHYQEKKKSKEKESLPKSIPIKPHFTRSRLAELSLVVDTGGAYRDTEVFNLNPFKHQ
ncbi:MAG: hypothetical protein A3B74_02090 [Candidatus Kerfeldbacteria bacterium RIFCSPHIGHO2_02_FULL_42_14]|uniref:PrgI family protein n=1 Tax=Candidatus Kerfeldbacteria bacterium RIFCSPHIGHO2_02_FULL_42_14 TaxID=1798540 RepID=A0A1G2ANH4_9BACT|nr:MAG: hypothetical protein A3B74_02090 [Candidatus Kerfeldbacteria bacterium RIFCSPHIGHO2_02_FULL_42_14]OGY81807.1 MAG: hypothetical protein A3E60_00665 [Candidatus Kerfeldbacteria bacterium RIFCSPHIGHO2_12_FULL_42_13]OGY84496.1 MAG: hypothetical protein A3I91_00280 [Candidatus Kerfeldbacteria bacterium RIFCSPLOWO2_02_FULL_42_19]OGY87603.1 MAG: hypothetical protein A3G01_02630 [Candidatus Kerfeldbacteria bacterium RIFCSPLOWO2_12_FULL_43_9]